MTKKESIISALVGSVIGLVLGYFMSMSMLEDAEKCRLLVEENKMLQQMVMDCQGD
jgi:ABC-type antimicrobial peptide transport system permease subunit